MNQDGLQGVSRLRRLRCCQAVRALVRETHLNISDLIAPLFIIEGGHKETQPINSMPGIVRHTIPHVLQEAESLLRLGIPAVILFPCVESSLKDDTGTEALNPNGLILRAIRALKQAVPELLLITDIALDPYTSHGHDGVLNAEATDIDNNRTVAILGQMAVLSAAAGADWIAPSDMMDGRVRHIRQKLDTAELRETAILAYAAKYASAFYGPFRDAVRSAKKTYLDKSTYQLEPANRRQAIREVLLDVHEGADAVMIKPAGGYLDIIHEARQVTTLPLAAYQVSGEYAQIHAAAQRGWLDAEACREESLVSIKRAGADMIVTYFAKAFAQTRA